MTRGPLISHFNFRDNRSVSQYDIPHRLVINHVYELPFGPKRQFLSSGILGRVVGGWNISGVWSMMTGTYFTPRIATSVSNAQDTNNGSPAERPDRLRRLVDISLPLDLPSPDTVRSIPVQLCSTYSARPQSDHGNTLHLPPTTPSI